MRFSTAAAFRQSLEERLRSMVVGKEGQLSRLRKMVAFERFMVRIQEPGDDRWLLKGGFALQLRIGGRARTTKDIDLSANLGLFKEDELTDTAIVARITDLARRNAGDLFAFEVRGRAELDLDAGPVRAYRCPVRALLDGRLFERFHVDVETGDPLVAPPETVPETSLLDFAELPPAAFRAIALEQHLAEKMHALTRTWAGQENSRTRDLVDLMLLLDLKLPSAAGIRSAVEGIFKTRATHELPMTLPDPPSAWTDEYARLAADLNLNQRTIDEAMARLRAYWKGLGWPGK